MGQPKAMILCIDDDNLALEARKELLEGTGYAVFTAGNGTDGLKIFRSNPIDAVVVDYEMPGMSGDRVASHMKRLKPGVPILMLSGHAELRERTLTDVDTFLCKDESWPTFVSALATLIEPRLSSFDHWWENWRHGQGPASSVRP